MLGPAFLLHAISCLCDCDGIYGEDYEMQLRRPDRIFTHLTRLNSLHGAKPVGHSPKHVYDGRYNATQNSLVWRLASYESN